MRSWTLAPTACRSKLCIFSHRESSMAAGWSSTPLVDISASRLQACNRQTAYCVPLYDTLGPDAVEYIIGHAEVTIVFASALKMRALVEPLSRAKGSVRAVIVWGEIDGIAKMVSAFPALLAGIFYTHH